MKIFLIFEIDSNDKGKLLYMYSVSGSISIVNEHLIHDIFSSGRLKEIQFYINIDVICL
jgi:hypothetical protein